ncbi:MAG TPA: hypothetical protein VMS56_02715 [Thermoanaerobaculia bacterium]|nr:hypothetical protein [Thermoanaerobaculia bacterium]
MEPRRQIPMLVIVWGAMVLSVVFYAFLAWLIVPAREDADPASWIANPVVVALHLVGFSALLASSIVPGLMARRLSGEAAARQAWIVRWALLESIAIFGLVLALFLRDARAFLLLGFLSLAGLALAYPHHDNQLSSSDR